MAKTLEAPGALNRLLWAMHLRSRWNKVNIIRELNRHACNQVVEMQLACLLINYIKRDFDVAVAKTRCSKIFHVRAEM